MNFLLTPSHMDHATGNDLRPDVVCGIIITDSRLDDELSVATIEFSDTPRWLQELNRDPRGFPKSTVFGTIWRGVDTSETDTQGRTAFINAVISSNGSSSNLLYAEMLAEFSDTDVNIQDTQGRTALHWACSENLPDMVRLCLSVPECIIGLKDNEGLTAFDISLQIADEMIPNLFYRNMFELEKIDPEAGLLRLLTVTSVPATDRAVFPGEAIFGPIMNRNGPLVKALVERGIDLTTTNTAGQTGLYLATQLCDVELMTMLLEAGADVNAPSMAGSTPLHCAAETGQVDVVQLLLDHGADVAAKDRGDKTALHYAEARRAQDVVSLLKAAEVEHRAGLELTDLDSQNVDQFADDDAQAALVEAVENEQVDPLSRVLESQLPPSCELPMMEWVDAVDRELITLISAPIDRNNAHFVKWDQYMAALDKNPALERLGDAIRKDKMFSFPRFRVPVILSGGRNNAKVLPAPVRSLSRRLILPCVSCMKRCALSSRTVTSARHSKLIFSRSHWTPITNPRIFARRAHPG